MHILYKENPARVVSGGASDFDLAWQRIGAEVSKTQSTTQASRLRAYVVDSHLCVAEVRYG